MDASTTTKPGWIDADAWLDYLQRDSPGRILVDRKPWAPTRPLNFADAELLARACGFGYEHQSGGATLINVGKRRIEHMRKTLA